MPERAAELVAALEDGEPGGDGRPRTASRRRSRASPATTAVVLVDVPPTAARRPRRWPRSRSTSATSGKGLGDGRRPRAATAPAATTTRRSRRRCRSTWACATARSSPTSRWSSSSTSRAPWPPATAPLQRRHGRRIGIARLREGRHRQGGDPARGRGARADRRARRRGLRRRRPLGGPDRAARHRRPAGNGLGIRADGQTNIYAGLEGGLRRLVNNPATRRHIILLTDGWSTSGQYDAILAEMKAAGITLSTVGAGGGSAPFLRQLAEERGGRFYDAADPTDDPRHLPEGDDRSLRPADRRGDRSTRSHRRAPDPARARRRRLPQLLGYNGTTAKGRATVSLVTGRDDPLLAQWQYGLGRSVAWTSDARQQWATPWIGTPEFGTLTAQLVAWTLPPQDAEGIDVRFSPGERRRAERRGDLVRRRGRPRNFYRTVLRLVSPDLEPTQTVLEQVGPGRYAGTVRADQPGAYLVRVAQTLEDGSGTDSASRTLGIVSPAAEEFRRLGIDADALAAYAAAGSGRRELRAQADEEAPGGLDARHRGRRLPDADLAVAAAAGHRPRPARRRRAPRGAQPRRPPASARWMARRVGLGRAEPEAVPGLAELRAAKERSDRRTGARGATARHPSRCRMHGRRPRHSAGRRRPRVRQPAPRPTPTPRADPPPAVEPRGGSRRDAGRAPGAASTRRLGRVGRIDLLEGRVVPDRARRGARLRDTQDQRDGGAAKRGRARSAAREARDSRGSRCRSR